MHASNKPTKGYVTLGSVESCIFDHSLLLTQYGQRESNKIINTEHLS